MNLFGKAKNKPVASDTSSTILKLRETLDSLDKRCATSLLRLILWMEYIADSKPGSPNGLDGVAQSSVGEHG